MGGERACANSSPSPCRTHMLHVQDLGERIRDDDERSCAQQHRDGPCGQVAISELDQLAPESMQPPAQRCKWYLVHNGLHYVDCSSLLNLRNSLISAIRIPTIRPMRSPTAITGQGQISNSDPKSVWLARYSAPGMPKQTSIAAIPPTIAENRIIPAFFCINPSITPPCLFEKDQSKNNTKICASIIH